jgi:hypothetical protein
MMGEPFDASPGDAEFLHHLRVRPLARPVPPVGAALPATGFPLTHPSILSQNRHARESAVITGQLSLF